jgi:hypothetical protein
MKESALVSPVIVSQSTRERPKLLLICRKTNQYHPRCDSQSVESTPLHLHVFFNAGGKLWITIQDCDVSHSSSITFSHICE